MRKQSGSNDPYENRRVFSCRSDSVRNGTDKSEAKVDLDNLLELGAYHYPLNAQAPDVRNHGANTIRALADMFTCKLTNYPIVVGIFAAQNKEDHLSSLASDLRSINNLADPPTLNFSLLLFLFPLFVSIVFGYLLGMMTNWQVGLSVGHVSMFLQITFLVVVIMGSRIFQHPMATQASHKIATFLKWLQLVLSVCFCYPTKPPDNRAPVKTVVVYHRLCSSSTPTVALFSMVDKMWTGLIHMYGEIPIQLQRASKPPTDTNERFRKVCCIPAFVVVITFWIAFIVNTGILRYHADNLVQMLGENVEIIIFIIMSSIIFLSLFGSLPSLYRIAKGLTLNPVKPLRTALAEYLSDETENEESKHLRTTMKCEEASQPRGLVNKAASLGNSTSLKNLAITAEEEKARNADMSIREEFYKLCRFSLNFDSFLGNQQTRFIICLDASETHQQDNLAKLIYQIHSLVLTESTAPVTFVIEADFKILLGEVASNALSPTSSSSSPDGHIPSKVVPQTLSDNLHLVRTSIHLPIYLESPVFLEVEKTTPRLAGEVASRGAETMANSIVTSPNGYSRANPAYSPSKRNTITAYTPRSIFPSRNPVTPQTLPNLKDDDGCITEAGDLAWRFRNDSVSSRSVESTQGIISLFIKDQELSTWNRKSAKQLVATVAFTSRLLRLCNLEIPIDELILWISLVHYWPYHIAWLMICLEEMIQTKATDQRNQTAVDLHGCMQEVKWRISSSMETLEPLIMDDRDLDRLDVYLRSKPPVSLIGMKKLISCVLTHNPYIRYCIRTHAASILRNSSCGDSLNHQAFLLTSPEEHGSHRDMQLDPSRPDSRYGSGSGLAMTRTDSSKAKRFNYPGSLMSENSADTVLTNPLLATETGFSPKMKDPPPFYTAVKPYTARSLEHWTMTDVCDLIAVIPNAVPSRLERYQYLARLNQINGTQFARGNLDKIRHDLAMEPNDWHAFCKLLLCAGNLTPSFPEPTINNNMVVKRQTVDYDDSESGSFVNALVIPNNSLQNTNSTHNPTFASNGIKSSMTSMRPASHSNTSRPVLIRQTPWLLSPQVSTGPPAAVEKHSETLTDSIFSNIHPLDNGENQTSLSGMEEPESLWQPKRGIPTAKTTEQMTKHNSIPIEQPNMGKLDTPGQLQDGVAHIFERRSVTPQTKRKTKRYTQQPSVHHASFLHQHHQPQQQPQKQQFNSRSTVDLRTVHGPFSHEPSNQELHQLKRAAWLRRQKHNSRWTTQSVCSHHVVYGPDGQTFIQAPRNSLKVKSAPFSPTHELCIVDNCLTSPPDTTNPIPLRIRACEHGLPTEEISDLRRMRKRPCRRLAYTKPLEACATDVIPMTIPLDSESDSYKQKHHVFIRSQTAAPNSSDNLIRNDSEKRYHVQKLPDPSSASSLTATTRFHPIDRIHTSAHRANPPSTFMAPLGTASSPAYWTDFIRMPLMQPQTMRTGEDGPIEPDSCKPSHKKRARRSNADSTSVQEVEGSQPGYFECYLDSDGEQCNCDYWYEMDRCGGDKMTLSEPTLMDNISEFDCVVEFPEGVETRSFNLEGAPDLMTSEADDDQ